jgi:steroid delta-isomerase-like uncharacterized protein
VAKESNGTIVDRVYELWNERDLDAAMELAAKDIDIRLVALGRTLTGHDGFRAFMERFATASSDIEKHVTNRVVEDDQVVTEFRLEGTHDGPLDTPVGSIAGTGRRIELEVVEVMGARLPGSATVPTRRPCFSMGSLMTILGADADQGAAVVYAWSRQPTATS